MAERSKYAMCGHCRSGRGDLCQGITSCRNFPGALCGAVEPPSRTALPPAVQAPAPHRAPEGARR